MPRYRFPGAAATYIAVIVACAALLAPAQRSSAQTLGQGLQLFTVPFDYSKTGLGLNDTLGYPSPKLAVWSPSSNTYAITPSSPADRFTPGTAYWVRVPAGVTASLAAGGQEPDRTKAFTIPLVSGWNMIGDPFRLPVHVSSLSVTDSSGTQSWASATTGQNRVVEPTIYAFDSASHVYVPHAVGSSSEADPVLAPYTGYWVHASASCTLTVPSVQGQTFVALLYGSQETPPNNSNATGLCTVVLAPDSKSASVSLSFTGLSSDESGAHIHGPAPAGVGGAPIVFDMDTPPGQFQDRLWTFQDKPGLSVSQLLTALRTGQLYANVHTTAHPGGEIRGQFTLVDQPPPLPGSAAPRADMPNDADAVRFLEQATFGPTLADIAHVKQIGLRAYLDEQFNAPTSSYSTLPNSGTAGDYPYEYAKTRMFKNFLFGQDQLRQRVAFALSQIMVTSYAGGVEAHRPGDAASGYLTTLTQDAFGTYRSLLGDVTLNPYMGAYLDMVDNVQGDPNGSYDPNENYAREIMQLFSIGTVKLNLDGSYQLDSSGVPISTYGNNEIKALARVFTGWKFANWLSPDLPFDYNNPDFLNPMIPYEPDHDQNAKTILGGTALPGGQTAPVELNTALDTICKNSNVGPFICRRLIQHLVTANPSRGYVQRVASVFNDNGQHVRGDLKAVVSAILLDGEAGGNIYNDPAYGHTREPILFITGPLRALGASGGGWGLSSYAASMRQDLLQSPTVFSYYQPDFSSSDSGSVFFNPEAQTLTTETEIARLNYIDDVVNNNIVPYYDFTLPAGDGAPVVDISHFQALASDPQQLLTELNRVFLHGSMSNTTSSAILTAISAADPADTATITRVALYLVLTSPEYQVER